MPASRKPRKRYRPRPVDADPVSLAMTSAATLSTNQQMTLLSAAEEAFGRFRAGRGGTAAWRDMADALNTAEALVDLGIGSDQAETFQAAQAALATVGSRHQLTGSWTLWASEVRVLDRALAVYALQLQVCSTREWRTAVQRVRDVVRGALAGNAGARCVMVGR